MNILTKKQLLSIKAGDVVERMLGGVIPVYVIVQKIENGIIDCGWTFNMDGYEVDEDISGYISHLSKILTEEQKELVRINGKL